MKKLLLVFAIFLGAKTICAQENKRATAYHQEFKKNIFTNSDSALFYIKQLKFTKKTSKHFLPHYYYHQDLGQYYFVKQVMDSSEYHYKQAFAISEKAGDALRSIDSNIWIANHEYFKGEIENCRARYQRILADSKKIDYLEGIATSYAMFASYEIDLSKRMNLYLKLDSLYTTNHKQSSLLARIYASIAGIYLEANGHNQLAISYINKCVAVSKKVAYPPGEYEANKLLVKLALQEKNYDKAIEIYKTILENGIAHKDPTGIDVGTLGLAKMYFRKGNLEQTESQLQQAAHLLKGPKGAVHLLWAELYLEKENPAKALDHITTAKNNPDLTDKLGYSIELNRVEINYFETIGDLAKAYRLKKEYDKQIAALAKQRNADGFILNQQIKFRERKEQEIALLQSQNDLTIQKQKNQRNVLLGGIGLSSFAIILLFILYRNRQKTARKLLEIDALKSTFFTNISHEFRTPLTLISSPIQETLAEPNLSAKKRRHFEMASQNTTRLLSLVDQLLELSKIDSGNVRLQLEHSKPTHYIAAWAASFTYIAKEKGIELQLEIKDKDLAVWFDKSALEKIVVNLLGNAIKYTPESGTIRLISSIENNQLLLKITNTGTGLNQTQLTHIFERFYQKDHQSDGAGIGLSLIKELTSLHQGTITASSKEHQWTSFDVTLSVDKNKFKKVDLIEATTFQKRQIRIPDAHAISTETENFQKNGNPILLIVEDNADVRVLIADLFKEAYQLITAENGAIGMQMALEQVPDLIISDVMMPVKDGIALTKALKEDERTSHIPIILLTAKAGDQNKLTGIDVGADDYISKPFNQKILKSKAANLIALRKKLRSRYSQEVILKPKDIAINSVDEQFLEKMQAVLDKQLVDSSFSAASFSKSLHMSRMQLHRKLKALTGLTTTEFIRSQRLKLAVQILRDSDINVSEVGYSVGFNDHAYFTKCFKEAYQTTP